MKTLINETSDFVQYEFTSGNAVKNIYFQKFNEDGEQFDTEKLSDDEYQRWLTWLDFKN
jgi:hypothetical protein